EPAPRGDEPTHLELDHPRDHHAELSGDRIGRLAHLRGGDVARRHGIVADVGDARHALVLVHARHGTVVLMLRCVVFDLETVLVPEAPDVVLDVMQRCFSRYRLGAVSNSGDGNVAVKSGLELSDWGRHIEVVVTPSEVEGAAAYR